uniref:Ras GTPase-activating protein 1 n=1 Tax=Nothobranchius furzeri TaxID=105023 RepID=A0A8C6PU91_NOTFU
MAAEVSSEDTSSAPTSQISPTSSGPDDPALFPPLPPPPASLGCGGLGGTMDESDIQDLPEQDDDEVEFPLSAPPTNQWYHGKLDRTIAEERLRQARNAGSYLIRESDRRPGSFVLSFLSMTNVVNHFRIIAMCGDYYIGGRRFSSLSDLIGYYSYVSCLLKGEKLLSPPVEDRRRVRAILPYTKVPDTDEISFLKGDMFIVHNELEDGWMWVTNVRTEEQGLIVEDLVEEVGREEDPHEGKIWYYGKITKQEAYNLLMTVGQVCSFLVRPSDNTPGDYSLFFRTSENIQRFKISPTPNNQYMMGGRYYNRYVLVKARLFHLTCFKEQIVERYNLKEPVSVQHQEQVLPDTVDGREIYNTIRRKTKDAFYKNIVKKGYLLFSKGKRWKNLYFILEGNDAQLIYFESEKRATKPKGLIDLSVCSVYGVHDSLFGRPNCFQIVVQHFSEEQYIFYFAGEAPEQAQDWLKCLQNFCSNLRKTTAPTSNKRLRQVSSLVLYVEEAHKLPMKYFTNPYCNIFLNSIQVAKTHPREGQNPVFTEEFIFDDLSSEINRFEISLSNKSKKSKENDILFMRCQLNSLNKGQMNDEWYSLSSHVPLKGIEPGTLRIRSRYSMEKIMPEEEYSEFKEMILQKDFHVIYALAHVCGQDRTLLASLLLRIFRHEKAEASLLMRLNDREISMEDEATTLFRATTLASTLMEQYMKATATPFVHHALKDTILKIMESKQSCELNPSKLEKNEDVNMNLTHLLNILSELVEKIFMAAEILPSTLRYIYGCLQMSVKRKWPNNTTMRTRVVSGFVFLRLICPAILNPRMFNIIADPPSSTAGRTLTLVAKSVQNLANLVEFGAKEPYMEGVNPFIKNNKHRMIMFLDELGNVPELPDTIESFRADLPRDLAALHEICVAHSAELRILSNERGAQQHVLKKLLAITELLQQKQAQYAMSNSNR